MKTKIIIAIVLTVMFATGGTLYLHHKNQSPSLKHSSTSTLYRCPMHPTYTSDKPGGCPICGMDLVPVEDKKPNVTEIIPPSPPFPPARPASRSEAGEAEKGDEGEFDRADVTISLDRQQLIGVKTDVVKKAEAVKEIRTVATAAFNPDLAIAQREYLESKKIGESDLTEAAKERLLTLGMNEEEIKRLKNVQKGLYLPSNDSWLYPVVYEYELPYVKTGQKVLIRLTNGKEMEGIVRSIDSIIDPSTRTARLHVEVKNQKENINPSAFGTANIKIDLGENLLVPKSAVITTGEKNIVFKVHEGTHFMPIDVKLGAELEDDYIVTEGLNEGDTVVTSANFLIDSESKLKAAIGGGGGGDEHKH